MPEAAPFDLFQWLPEPVIADFNRLARIRRIEAGEIIYSQGDVGARMYRLSTGAVRLSVARGDGRELLYLLFQPGDCFGVSSLIDGQALPHTAEAATATAIQVLDKAGFERLRHDHRAFDDALLRLVTQHMRLLSGYFADAHLDDLASRVASRVLATARSFGRVTPAGVRIALSQAELALMVGGARQTVNRVLQQFCREGLLRTTPKGMVVTSLERLEIRVRKSHEDF